MKGFQITHYEFIFYAAQQVFFVIFSDMI